MSNREDPNDSDGVGFGLAGIGAVALRVACCGGLPHCVVLASRVALGTSRGVGAGIVALVGLVALVVVRVRRRAACKTPEPPTAPVESSPRAIRHR